MKILVCGARRGLQPNPTHTTKVPPGRERTRPDARRAAPAGCALPEHSTPSMHRTNRAFQGVQWRRTKLRSEVPSTVLAGPICLTHGQSRSAVQALRACRHHTSNPDRGARGNVGPLGGHSGTEREVAWRLRAARVGAWGDAALPGAVNCLTERYCNQCCGAARSGRKPGRRESGENLTNVLYIISPFTRTPIPATGNGK